MLVAGGGFSDTCILLSDVNEATSGCPAHCSHSDMTVPKRWRAPVGHPARRRHPVLRAGPVRSPVHDWAASLGDRTLHAPWLIDAANYDALLSTQPVPTGHSSQ